MRQQMQSVQQNHEQDDELRLIAIWKVLVERKLLVIVFTTLTAMGAIYYTLTLPTIYKSEVLMVPVDNNSSTESLSSIISSTVGFIPGVGKGNFGVVIRQELARLKTRLFLVDFIISKNLKPIFFFLTWLTNLANLLQIFNSHILTFTLTTIIIIRCPKSQVIT